VKRINDTRVIGEWGVHPRDEIIEKEVTGFRGLLDRKGTLLRCRFPFFFRLGVRVFLFGGEKNGVTVKLQGWKGSQYRPNGTGGTVSDPATKIRC